MKKIAKALLLIFSVALLAAGLLAARVYSYRNTSSNAPADAAVVLGAAVWGAEVSPVFRERINHGIDLYRKGKVRKLIFTREGRHLVTVNGNGTVAVLRLAQAGGEP